MPKNPMPRPPARANHNPRGIARPAMFAVTIAVAGLLTACAPTQFYPISGKQQTKFEHARTICRAAIAGSSPKYVAPSSWDDQSAATENLSSQLRWQIDQNNLFAACMLRHGWEARRQ